MAKGLPYFKWYPADAEMDRKYRAMGDADLGFFHRCLNYAWSEGGLPADATSRARVLGRRKAEADKRWEVVGECWVPSPGDPSILVNPRQERERASAISKSEQASGAIRKRWGRTTTNDTDVDTGGSSSYSDSESDSENQNSSLKIRWPLSCRAARKFFPATDDGLISRLVAACVKEYPPLSDSDLADAILAAHTKKQTSAGLYLKTVPQVIRTWVAQRQAEVAR